jgi:hypothetical protein
MFHCPGHFVETCFLSSTKKERRACALWKNPGIFTHNWLEFSRKSGNLFQVLPRARFSYLSLRAKPYIVQSAHLAYVLIRELQRTHIGAAGDLPIVWATTLWRQNRHAQKACCIEFDPLLVVNAHSDDTPTTIQISLQESVCLNPRQHRPHLIHHLCWIWYVA